MSFLTKFFRSGVEEQRRLAAQSGKPLASDAQTFRKRQHEEQEAGETCNVALYADETKQDELAAPTPPQSAYVLPVVMSALCTVLSLTAAFSVALLFNTQTVNGSSQVLLLIPAALVAMKLSGSAHKIGRYGELRSMSEKATGRLFCAFIASFITGVGWGVARSIPKMGDTAAALVNAGMWACELSAGWAAAEAAVLLFVHARPALHFRSARKFQRLADATETVTAVVGAIGSNGAGPVRRAPDRRFPSGVSDGS